MLAALARRLPIMRVVMVNGSSFDSSYTVAPYYPPHPLRAGTTPDTVARRLMGALLPLPFYAPPFYRGVSPPPTPSGVGIGFRQRGASRLMLSGTTEGLQLQDRSFGGTTLAL